MVLQVKLASALFKRLGCEVIELYCEVDGNFPAHDPDPSRLENLTDLIQAVRKNHADLGLTFDGDGDRLGVVDHEGEIIDPGRQCLLYAQDILSRQPGAEIIYDVKTSSDIPKYIEKLGGKATISRTGHSFMKQKLKHSDALFAAEMSGHFFFKERWYGFDDGIYTAARLVEIIALSSPPQAFQGRSWRDGRDGLYDSSVFPTLPHRFGTPEWRIPMPDDQKFEFMDRLKAHIAFDAEVKLTLIDGIRADFKTGWGLVRASNTTPCLIARFEAHSLDELNAIQEQFRRPMLLIDHTLKTIFLEDQSCSLFMAKTLGG